MILLRSLLFNLIFWLSVPVYAPLALLTFPLPYRWRYRLISAWARFHTWLAKVLLRIDYTVEGREHLPTGAAILLGKHQSTWETIAFQTIFPMQTWVLKRELMWIPLFGWALTLMKPIAINRGAGRKAVEQVVEQGRERLHEGIWVVIFPEGTRTAPGQRRRYGLGGAVLAEASGYPVVPVAHNAGHFWPRRKAIKQPGTVRVVIGPAIDPRGLTAAEINRRAEAWIESTVARLEGRAT
ncbi:MAG: lysophospholipid acyltransferase family protein [Pseudomonadota bacterium]